MLSVIKASAQGIGINTTSANADISAILDVSSTNQGVLIPRMTDSLRQILKDPAEGLMIYNTTTNEFNFWNGTSWKRIPGINVSSTKGSGTGPGSGIAINTIGNAPDSSAILDISANDKGLLIPRLRNAPATNVAGLLIYNIVTEQINYYNGSSWQVPCSLLMDNNKSTGAIAQGVAISSTDNEPAASAILDISSDTKGVLIPRMTSAQRDSIQSPAIGLIIYNTTSNNFDYWLGSVWYEWGIPLNVGPVIGNDSLCTNTIGEAYSISPVTGATSYSWSVPSDATITAGQGTTGITVTFGTAGGNICVTASNTCGTSSPSCLAVTVNPIPIITITPSSQTIASGSSTSLVLGGAGGGGTYIWSETSNGVNGATNFSSSCPTTITDVLTYTSSPGTVTYTVTGTTSSGCTGTAAAIVTVTVTLTVTCGGPFTVVHTKNVNGAPVTRTVTYGTVYKNFSGVGQCWITQNLGAIRQATAAIDTTDASAGWYWQWDEIQQGWDHNGISITPAWINGISGGDGTWITSKDPCNFLLNSSACGGCATPAQSGWRLPTVDEWCNWGFTDYLTPYNSDLKLHDAGYLFGGALEWRLGNQTDGYGNTLYAIHYWSSERVIPFTGQARSIFFQSSFHTDYNSCDYWEGRGYALTLRCLRILP